MSDIFFTKRGKKVPMQVLAHQTSGSYLHGKELQISHQSSLGFWDFVKTKYLTIQEEV